MSDEEGPDEAAQAFEELRAEVTLMRRAVERLTAERMEVLDAPDYSETLGVIANNITVTAQRVDLLAKSPMLAMTPEQMATRISAASSAARQEDRQMIATTHMSLEDTTRQLRSYVASARRSDEQNRWLAMAGAVGILVGMIFWATLAPPIARALPASWHVPETMAASTLDRPMWDAGRHLMITDAPASWNAIVDAWNVVEGDRKTVEDCLKAAAKAKDTVRCTITVEPVPRRW